MIFLKRNLEKAKERYKKNADCLRLIGPKLKVGNLVWLKRPDLLPKGPAKLTNRKLVMLWKGLPATECTWLSEDEITDPQLVQEFNKTNRVPSRL